MRILGKIKFYFRKKYVKKQKQRLLKKDICLISSNCNGAMILHDLGLKFQSPFVNLWISPKDFIKMLEAFHEYMKEDLVFVNEEGIDYPVGMLKDIKIHFQHYASESEAKQKWDERCKRLKYDDLYVLFTDRDGCSEEDLLKFDQLHYERKKVFVNHPRPNLKSAVYIRGFEDEPSVGQCMVFEKGLSYKRYYDQFDYVEWFNS